MITFAHWGGVKMCANRPPEGQAWNGGRGRGWHCQPLRLSGRYLGNSRAPQVSPALELKGGRKTLLRKAVPSRGFARRFKALSGGFGLCKSTVKKKKRHQQGPAGATSSPPKTQSLLVTTWRVLQSSYKLATDSWGLSSVIGFPAAICCQTDPMPSQTADSSSYSCAALAQTRNNVKRTDGQTVLRRLFKPFLGIILVYFTNKLQWDIPSFK
jgi:hypothetical protein